MQWRPGIVCLFDCHFEVLQDELNRSEPWRMSRELIRDKLKLSSIFFFDILSYARLIIPQICPLFILNTMTIPMPNLVLDHRRLALQAPLGPVTLKNKQPNHPAPVPMRVA